jgi:hypothetical protein
MLLQLEQFPKITLVGLVMYNYILQYMPPTSQYSLMIHRLVADIYNIYIFACILTGKLLLGYLQ